MWISDDISFCPNGRCRRRTCFRNQANIRDRSIPHSYFTEIPDDCPKKGDKIMACGLCKKNNETQGMSAILKDVNGNTTVKLCQTCLKKLKNAVKNPKQMNVDIYPADSK